MLEERTHEGYWWLPGDEDSIGGGVVNYSPEDGIWLETYSALTQDPELLGSETVFRPPIIHGTTTEGRNITLRRCARNQYSFQSQGGATGTPSQYLVLEMVEGAHLDESEPEFSRVKAGYPLLDYWARLSGITNVSGSLIDDPPEEVTPGEDLNIHYEIPDTISAELDEFTLEIAVNTNVTYNQTGGVEIIEDPYVNFAPQNSDITYYDAIDLVGTFQDFLTLATGKELEPKWIEATIPTESEGGTQVRLVIPPSGVPHEPDSMHPLKANFILADILDDFETIITNWFERSEALKPVFNSYFGVLYNPRLYIQNQFLSLSRAIESYHRENYPDEYLGEDDFRGFYEDMVEFLPEGLPGDFRDHLVGGTFKYANEYSLRKRLSDLVEELDSFLTDYPWDAEAEVDPITDTRNYLTHHDDSIEGAEPDRVPEFKLILQSILETILLRDLGLPDDQIRERVSQRYYERTR